LGSNINFNNYFEQNVYYQATVNVDGLSATSERFKIDLPKSGKTCFCNRDMTPEELKNIVVELRKQEVYIEKGRLVKNTNGAPILKDGKKQFVDITMYDELHEDLFKLDYQEKLNSSDANFNKFAEALNKVFKDYDINTCIRKIHFLAQCYHETQRFMATYEKNPNSNVNGGPFYRGRGLIQLTHDYNYEKLRKALKINSTLNEFAPRVAKEINLACQASGYFWRNIGAKTGNISQYADKDDVLTVSREINGYVSVPYGFNDRKLFTNILKNVMRYDQCKNKK
jgi:predicted chitinase